MTSPIVLRVEGSKGSIYTIAAARVGNNLTVSCSCPAGVKRQACRHRIDLLLGDLTEIVDGEGLVEALHELAKGTDVAAALADYFAAIEAHGEGSLDARAARKALSRALDDGPASRDLRGLVGQTEAPLRERKPRVPRKILMACPDGEVREMIDTEESRGALLEWARTGNKPAFFE